MKSPAQLQIEDLTLATAALPLKYLRAAGGGRHSVLLRNDGQARRAGWKNTLGPFLVLRLKKALRKHFKRFCFDSDSFN